MKLNQYACLVLFLLNLITFVVSFNAMQTDKLNTIKAV